MEGGRCAQEEPRGGAVAQTPELRHPPARTVRSVPQMRAVPASAQELRRIKHLERI